MTCKCYICKKELFLSEMISHDCSNEKYVIGIHVCGRCGRKDLSRFELDFGHECQVFAFKEQLKECEKHISAISEGFDRISERMNLLETNTDFKQAKELIYEGAQTHASILSLQAKIKNLEKEWESKVDVDRWCEHFSMGHSKKTPHKCPVCEGTRLCQNEAIGLSWQCESCEGKGIVWG